MARKPPTLTESPDAWVLGLTHSLCDLGQLTFLLGPTHSSAVNRWVGTRAGPKTSAHSLLHTQQR